MIECGVEYKKLVLSPLWCGIDKVDGLLVSHQHKDHALELPHFRSMLGDDKVVYGAEPDLKVKYNLGNWIVKPHGVPHYAIRCHGFEIYNIPEDKTFAFFTDCTAQPVLVGIDYWLYEVNFDEDTAKLALDLVGEELKVDTLTDEQKAEIERLQKKENHVWFNIRSHNSLENAEKYLQAVTKAMGRKIDNMITIHKSLQYLNENKVKTVLGNYVHNLIIGDDNMEVEYE